jgi:single-strand DNA-binding protein
MRPSAVLEQPAAPVAFRHLSGEGHGQSKTKIARQESARAMNKTTITLAGNAVADPELRYTPSGVPVANFRVASTTRIKTDQGWQDGDTLFLAVNAWRDLAEHVAQSIHKGDRVIVTGRLRQRTYDSRDGGQVTVTEVEAADVGVSLQRGTAAFTRAQRSTGEPGNGGQQPPF